jgi:hypothetical protein
MRGTLLALVVLVSALSGAGPAAAAPGVPAAPAEAAKAAGARLTITVRPASGGVRTARLTCDPVGGDHPRAAEACTTLTPARGNPGRIAPQDGMCTMEYAPVKVSLRGRWHARPVRYEQTFGNACAMSLATGSVFEL